MSVLREGFLELAWPARCVGCDLPGTLLCADCEGALPLIDVTTACPYCGAPYGVVVCTECDAGQAGTVDGEQGFPFTAVRCAGSFVDTLARMLVIYKDGGERRLAVIIARLMVICARSDWRLWADALVFIPASPQAYRRRGFDHMELIAKHMARMMRIPLRDALERRNVRDQRILGREERADNASGSLLPVSGMDDIIGKNILLVDDVFTTGATAIAASEVLLNGGVREIRVVVAARVW